jgi:hypothetical protein
VPDARNKSSGVAAPRHTGTGSSGDRDCLHGERRPHIFEAGA